MLCTTLVLLVLLLMPTCIITSAWRAALGPEPEVPRGASGNDNDNSNNTTTLIIIIMLIVIVMIMITTAVSIS